MNQLEKGSHSHLASERGGSRINGCDEPFHLKFAKRLFSIAGIYGLIVLLPQYFLEAKNGRDFPPAITHPEYYYGFIGVGVACQILFLLIARDPLRYRAMMIPAVIEKFSFGIAIITLFLLNRVSVVILVLSCVDLALGTLFIIAYKRTPADYIKAQAKSS